MQNYGRQREEMDFSSRKNISNIGFSAPVEAKPHGELLHCHINNLTLKDMLENANVVITLLK